MVLAHFCHGPVRGNGAKTKVSANRGKLHEHDYSFHVFKFKIIKRTQLERKSVFRVKLFRVLWLWLSRPEKGQPMAGAGRGGGSSQCSR